MNRVESFLPDRPFETERRREFERKKVVVRTFSTGDTGPLWLLDGQFARKAKKQMHWQNLSI
jgi:hypothetical protein